MFLVGLDGLSPIQAPGVSNGIITKNVVSFFRMFKTASPVVLIPLMVIGRYMSHAHLVLESQVDYVGLCM